VGSTVYKPLPMISPVRNFKSIDVSRTSSEKVLHLTVNFPYADPAGIQRFADSVSNPKSPNYRHFITPEEVGNRFGLPKSQIQEVSSYLKGYGMSVNLVAKNRLSIRVDATVAQAEAAFKTQIEDFVVADKTQKDRLRFAFTKTPSLPATLARRVSYVSGLENFTRPKPHGYNFPSQIRQAYGINPYYNAGSLGQGRTIAISNFDGFSLGSLPTFYSNKYFTITPPAGGVGSNVTVVPISGGAQNGTVQGEGDLDIQTILGVAPACNLRIYDGGDHDLFGVLTAEANENIADVVSESWGWRFFDSSTGVAAHNIHLSMTAQGITYMAATGDSGTSISEYPYPDVDPEVLLVGGTSLTTDANGNRTSETGWSGGGGGWNETTDVFNVLPSWQKGTGVPKDIPYRLVPDVALNADPNTGYVVVILPKIYVFGGTSGASPTFAGSLGVAEQKLIAAGQLPPDGKGKQRFGRIQDLIYSFNGDSGVFYDVTSGSNGTLPSNHGTANAGAGWDFVTGWGAMNFSGFVNKLSATSKVSSLSLNVSSVEGGSSTTVTGTVTLSSPSPALGTTVNLTSSDPSVVVPSTLSIPNGSSTGTFKVTTSAVPSTLSVKIQASAGSSSASATLSVTTPKVTLLGLSAITVVNGSTITGKVTIDQPAPSAGLNVGLTSSDPTVATVPGTVQVVSGQTSATFTITSLLVTKSSQSTITASAGGSSVSGTLTVTPATFQALTLGQSTVVGGNPVNGTVSLSGPAATATTVALTVSKASLATLSSPSVTIPAGSSSAPFTVTPSVVTSTQTVSVTGTLGTAKSATLTIKVPSVASIAVSIPTSLGGVDLPKATITLTGPAGTTPLTVKLASSPTTVATFAATSVVIPAGQSSAMIGLNTSPVSADTTVNLSASLNGSTAGSFVVRAAQLQSIGLAQTSVQGKTSVNGTLSLEAKNGLSERKVTLVSSDPSVVVPTSAIVAAGGQSVTFVVKTLAVTASKTVTITATLGTVVKTVALTVTP
jgi:subtilase family serine protease